MKYFTLSGLVIMGLLGCVSAQDTNTIAPVEPPQPIPLSQVISQTEMVSQQLNNLENDLLEDEEILENEKKFDRFENEVQAFYKESSRLLGASPSLDRIRWLESGWKYISYHLNTRKNELIQRAERMEKELANLERLQKVWTETARMADANPDLPTEAGQRIRSILTEIAVTAKKVTKQQDRVLAQQSRLTELDIRVNDMVAATEEGRKKAIDQLLERNIPAVWNVSLTNRQGEPWFSGAVVAKSWCTQYTNLRTYFSWQQSLFLAHATILILLVILLVGLRKYIRSKVESDAKLTHAGEIFERPIAAAFLLALIAASWIYPMQPRLLTALMGAFILIPTVIILRGMLVPRLFIVLNALVIFYFIDQLRLVLVSLTLLSRFVFLAQTVAAILFLLYILRTFHRGDFMPGSDRLGRIVRAGAKCAVLLLTVALLANLLGFGHLSTLVRNGVMRSAYAAVMLYAALEVLSALLLIAFHIPPISHLGMVQLHEATLLRRIDRFFHWVIVLLWLFFVLVTFSLWTPLAKSVGDFLSAEHAVGSVKFSLSDALMLGFTIWGAFLLSKFLRFVLDSDVYPRVRLPHGVPYAISTMLHYVILLIAFLGVAAVLGFDMTKVTILVSALGVGIGFGLQNIINNFVSGLILLFERPIKVGDSIQIGGDAGIVQQIGIRASVLLTTSGSKIIVPNGALISERVTNWGSNHERKTDK